MTLRIKPSRTTLLLSALNLLTPAGDANAQTNAAPADTRDDRAQVAPIAALEPKAVELLKASSARLAAAHTLSFTARSVQYSWI